MLLPQTKALTAHDQNGLVYYTFPALDALPFVRHGFSTRLGGVSRGDCEAMNLSFSRGDDPAAVMENFRRHCAVLDTTPDRVVLSKQTHTVNVRRVTAADAGNGVTKPQCYEDVDGLMTDEPEVMLCTQHADCVPLFFADPVRRVIALSHSGWRGTAGRMGPVTVAAMCREYGCDPKDIVAGIGPSIGPCCFEVDAPVYETFAAMPEWDAGLATQRGEKYDLDLWELNRRLLLSAGLESKNVTVTDLCTKCHPELFWSHRVTGGKRGSLAAFLMMK